MDMGGRQFPVDGSFSPGILSSAKLNHLFPLREEGGSASDCFGRKGWGLGRGRAS